MAKFKSAPALIAAHIEDLRAATDGSSHDVINLAMSTVVVAILMATRSDRYATLKALDVLMATVKDEIAIGSIETRTLN